MPYGYTVTLWSSGALLMHARGTPDVADVFLFMAGALGAFIALGGLVRNRASDGIEPSAAELVTTAIVNVVVVSAAVGAVALIGLIPSAVDWALGSWAATTIYLGGCALTLAFACDGKRHNQTAPHVETAPVGTDRAEQSDRAAG